MNRGSWEIFCTQTEKINELLGVVYKEQKIKREAELKILHEQIKPHLLYNTLDTIQWMVKQYHALDIVDLVLALSGFFPYWGFESGKESLSIETGIFNGKELSGHPESDGMRICLKYVK